MINHSNQNQDPAIIVINKPPAISMQVITSDIWFSDIWFLCNFFTENLFLINIVIQGGVAFKHSGDTLGAVSLKYDHSEPPRLVSLITVVLH